MLGRVAYVVNVFPKLSETFIAWELAELRRRGVEVCILSLRPPDEGRRHEIVREAGLEERVIYDPKEFRAALLEFQPELLHAHFATEPTAAARELAAELRVPFTFTAHGYDIYRKPPADFADRAGAASAVITVSEANARYIVKTFGVPTAQIHVIPCGVDGERFSPQGGRRATIAALTSTSEGMPVCLMEAAACGVPAVAVAVGGIPELVEDGVTGVLVPVGDTRALASALEQLLRKPELAARMGVAARRRVEERFSIRRQVDCLLALWTEVVGVGARQ